MVGDKTTTYNYWSCKKKTIGNFFFTESDFV